MKIIVLNSENDEIVIADIPKERDGDDFIRNEISMRPKDCNWIIREELNIRIL